MPDVAPPVLFGVLVWWLSTGVIVYLAGFPQRARALSLTLLGALAAGALVGLYQSRHDTSWSGPYVAFICSVVVWGWHELAFLTGWVTGPRKEPCPPTSTGWARFRLATLAVIHHELALFGTWVAIVGLTYGGANQVGMHTFLVLWVMRLSAKFNLFLGVQNLTEEFIPEHLKYLLSYLKKAPYTWLMPVSVSLATLTLLWLLRPVVAFDASEERVVATSLVATMLALAILEHLFLVVPAPDAVLWRWALRARERGRTRIG